MCIIAKCFFFPCIVVSFFLSSKRLMRFVIESRWYALRKKMNGPIPSTVYGGESMKIYVSATVEYT